MMVQSGGETWPVERNRRGSCSRKPRFKLNGMLSHGAGDVDVWGSYLGTYLVLVA